MQKIVEKFHHDPAVPANSDIAEQTFLLQENRIQLVYHLEKGRITPSTREFTTPPLRGEQAQALVFNPEMTSAYQVDPYAKEPKQQHLFELLEKMVAAQEGSIAQIRAAEQEVREEGGGGGQFVPSGSLSWYCLIFRLREFWMAVFVRSST